MLNFDETRHEYFTEEGKIIPSVTTILNHISAVGYSAVPQSTLDYARMRGSAVHEALELYDYGIPFEEQEGVTPEIVGYINAYLTFIRDYKPTWTHIEHIVYNEEQHYCGTLDRAGVINGRRAIVDIKTVASPTIENKACVCAQTSAYGETLYGDFKHDRYALYLKKDGSYTLMDCAEFEEERGFLGWSLFYKCKSIYETLETIKNTRKKRRK